MRSGARRFPPFAVVKLGFVVPLLLLLAACGDPIIVTPEVVEYDGSSPVVGEPNGDGLVVIESARRDVQIEVDVDDTTDSTFAGTVITYEETGDTGILRGFNTETGAAGMYTVDLAGYPLGSVDALRLKPQADPISVSILLVSTFVAWNELRMLNQEINVTVERVPSASIEDGVVEMCLTPDDFTYLTLGLAASQAKAIDNYETFISGVLFVFMPGPGAELRDHLGQLIDSGHLVESLFTTQLSDEVRSRAAQELGSTDFGTHDTLQVTLLDFREPVGVGDSYYWATMFVTGAGCDPATFTEAVGSVAITSPLQDVSTTGDSLVKVEVDPPEEGLDVHLTYEVRDEFLVEDVVLLRRLPPVETNESGVAYFAVPPFDGHFVAWADSTSTLTATVPERRVSTTREISWPSRPSEYGFSPHVWNFRLLGSQAIVDQPAAFTFADLDPDHAASCEVDWGEGNGWESFVCTESTPIFRRQLRHTYRSAGLFTPKLRVSNSDGESRGAYTMVSVAAEPPPRTPPLIEVASFDGESFSWRFSDENPLALHECFLEDPPFMQMYEAECPRQGSVPLDYLRSGAVFTVVSSWTGLSASIDVREGVNNGPEARDFIATPSTLTEGESTTFTWAVSDLDGDSVTCRIDADGNGTTDHTIPSCETDNNQSHQYETAGTYTATLDADDGRGGTAEMSTTVTVEHSGTPTGTTFTTIRAGSHSLALDQDGNAWSWGSDYSGQLGDGGTNTDVNIPVQVVMPTGTTFTTIAGFGHSLALDQQGNAWSWGSDRFGQLGDGGSETNVDTPVPVVMPTDVTFTTIEAGENHSLALDTDGNAWSWGHDQLGQLGDGGTNTNKDTPVQVVMPTGTTFTSVAAGGWHSLALDQDGNAWSWGRNYDGELGNGGTYEHMATPVQIAMPTGTSFSTIAAGYAHSLALDTNGNAWSWGDDSDGQLGDGGTNTDMGIPVQVVMPTGTTFTTIAAGYSHSLARDQDGNAWSWGNDFHGQLGDGGTNTDMDTPVQVATPTGTTFTTIASSSHSLALDQQGNAWSWGWDDNGQLGDGGSNTDMDTPVPVVMP